MHEMSTMPTLRRNQAEGKSTAVSRRCTVKSMNMYLEKTIEMKVVKFGGTLELTLVMLLFAAISNLKICSVRKTTEMHKICKTR